MGWDVAAAGRKTFLWVFLDDFGMAFLDFVRSLSPEIPFFLLSWLFQTHL